MHSGYWLIGKWKRVPIFFHWTIFLWLPWHFWQERNVTWAVLSFLSFVVLLFAHEIGHAVVAKARRTKVFAIRLYVLHGQCEHEHPYYEEDDVFIAWGGVLAQFIVLIFAVAAKYMSQQLWPQSYYFLMPVFFVLINVNIVIAAINLIPVQPLDGYTAWRALPLLRKRIFPKIKVLLETLWNALNFKRRRALAKESARITTEFLSRFKEK